MQAPWYCINCGEQGHTCRSCAQPITSYGVILFGQYRGKTRYLMIQRKDSIAFIEFVRGKYHLGNRAYIMRLFGDMTADERSRIRTLTFHELWKSLWSGCERTRSTTIAYRYSEAKFYMIRRGYTIILNDDASTPLWFDLSWVLENQPALYECSEWEFPKGRRKHQEGVLACALREFSEETGIHHSDVRIVGAHGPFEESYVGSNGYRYSNMYFLAEFNLDVPSDERMPVVENDNWTTLIQAREVSAVKWAARDEALALIRPFYAARKALFDHVDWVVRQISEDQTLAEQDS